MLLLIDNYDGSTINLYQYFSLLGEEVLVVQNNITVSEVERMAPDYIVISPGLSVPMGICDVILSLGPKIPILGVCLGHQLIGLAYGGALEKCGEIVFGGVSLIYHDGKGLFTRMPNPFWAMRNHTHVVSGKDFPDCLEVTAWTEDGLVMGLRHTDYPIEGVQFHLSPIKIDVGKNIVGDFVKEKLGVVE